jgi:hypothetical protein
MTIATYSELLTELDAWLNRSDLTARIPTFIRLFESRANRQLRVPEMALAEQLRDGQRGSQLSLPPTSCRPATSISIPTPTWCSRR